MDIRDVIRNSQEIMHGHEPVTERLNVRNEVRRFCKDPLQEYLIANYEWEAAHMHGDIGRYAQAFSWYALCLRRVLDHVSVARRVEEELRWHPATAKYSPRQAQIAQRRNSTERYLELDHQNLIIHACILLDRTIALSRRFLSGTRLPSFTSFSDHKRFLKMHSGELDSAFRPYAEGVLGTTDWFEVPLKVLRDKYLMHSAERHMSSFGWEGSNLWDLQMMTIIGSSPGQEKWLGQTKMICFSPRRLARDVEAFLCWFSNSAQIASETAHSNQTQVQP